VASPFRLFFGIQGAAKNTSPDKNYNFSELDAYFTTKFCTIILKG